MMIQNNRQADAEIEVTEAMAAAGVEALRSLDLLNDPFRHIAETIYRAMVGFNIESAASTVKRKN